MVSMVARPGADWYEPENVEGQNRDSISVCDCGATSPVLEWGWAGPSFLGCRSSLRPAGAGMERYDEATRGSITLATTPPRQGSDSAATARVLRPGCSRRPTVGQCADMSVAQTVIDQCEQFSCRGDLRDVLAAAGLDPCAIG